MWLSLGATFLPSPQQRPIPADAAIVLAIRIFDGTAEVTAETRVHVYPAGTRGEPLAADFLEGLGHQVPVTPGIYDVPSDAVRGEELPCGRSTTYDSIRAAALDTPGGRSLLSRILRPEGLTTHAEAGIRTRTSESWAP